MVIEKHKTGITISRSERNPKLAYVLFPHSLLEGCDSADVEYDGGFLIRFVEGGKYRIGANGTGKSTSWRLTIPSAFSGFVPFGITQCDVDRVDPHTIRLSWAGQERL